MAQVLTRIDVEVAAAGTAVRVVTDPASPLRYQPYAYFEANFGNAGAIYVGGADVSDAAYTALLNGNAVDRSFNWSAYNYPASPNPQMRNQTFVDLYETWVDAATSGDKVFVTISPNQ